MSAYWLVTGANRGIGLHMVQQFRKLGEPVIATCRDISRATELKKVDGVRIETLDVTSDASISALAEKLTADSVSLRAIVNNAGIFNKTVTVQEDGEEKQYDSYSSSCFKIDAESFVSHFRMNSLSPFFVTKALHPLLDYTNATPVIAHISSIMGSIECSKGANNAGHYRVSKAALNMVNTLITAELSSACCVVLHPGWVKTDMGGDNAAVEPVDSAAGLVKVLRGLKKEQTGQFFDYTGASLPW